jgi:hypothetical protein
MFGRLSVLKRVLTFLPLIFFLACVPPTSTELPSAYQTGVVQTLTAKMWTPTFTAPAATLVPDTSKIVEILNNAMVGSDPLAETVEAKFSVTDARIVYEPSTNLAVILLINVECESIYTNNCTLEGTFVALMHAFIANEKIIGKISEQVPVTVHSLQMAALNHMAQTGMVTANWNDVVDFANGKINGSQLGTRIVRLPTP